MQVRTSVRYLQCSEAPAARLDAREYLQAHSILRTLYSTGNLRAASVRPRILRMNLPLAAYRQTSRASRSRLAHRKHSRQLAELANESNIGIKGIEMNL